MIGNLMTMIAGKYTSAEPSLSLSLCLSLHSRNLTRNLCIDAWLLPVLDLRLTHKGRPLLAGDHFSDHNIKHGSTIECTLRRPFMRRRMLLRL